jgi:5-methylcytosine-specific restriction endonuclease McrA
MRIHSYNKNNSAAILVLNTDYLPINVTTFKKAFKLVYKGKAEIVEDEGNIIVTNKKTFRKPTVIRLINYVVIPYRKIVLSRENIFKRDGHKCVYCSSVKNLTIDHVIPKSKGGKNNWDNLVTCCSSCNAKKGDRTPEQANLKLNVKPSKPHPLYFIYKSYKNRDSWQQYLMFKE